MKVIAFITEYVAVDRIIDHLKLRFVAEKPPPSHVFTEVALMAAEAGSEYFLCSSPCPALRSGRFQALLSLPAAS